MSARAEHETQYREYGDLRISDNVTNAEAIVHGIMLGSFIITVRCMEDWHFRLFLNSSWSSSFENGRRRTDR